jgi:hypothetical protein
MLLMAHISFERIIVTYLTQHLFLEEQVVQEGNVFPQLKWKFYLKSAIGINHARESGKSAQLSVSNLTQFVYEKVAVKVFLLLLDLLGSLKSVTVFSIPS